MQFRSKAGVLFNRHVKLEALVMALGCEREMIPFQLETKPHVCALPSSREAQPVHSPEGPVPSLSYRIHSYLIPVLNHAYLDIGLRTYTRATVKIELIDYMRLEQDLSGRRELAEFREDHWHYEVLNTVLEKPVKETQLPRKEWAKSEKADMFHSFIQGNFRSEKDFLLWLRYQCPLELKAESVFQISDSEMSEIVSCYLEAEVAKVGQ